VVHQASRLARVPGLARPAGPVPGRGVPRRDVPQRDVSQRGVFGRFRHRGRRGRAAAGGLSRSIVAGVPDGSASLTARLGAGLLALLIVALAVVVFPRPASARPSMDVPTTALAAAPCSLEEWRVDPVRCLEELPDVAGGRLACLEAPPPDTPDAGLGGWFAERPVESQVSGASGFYSKFAYAGYSYTTYDVGCAQTLMHPNYKFENTVANGEFMLAVAVIGAANAVRERAWDPGVMWGWANPLVEQATRALYERVFTVFGWITLAAVGVYLLWRSRQAEMSAAVTTAGWAILVMLVVTALARWPVYSAQVADQALVTSLNAVHTAVGPSADDIPPELCPLDNPQACIDSRSPALRASDTAVETMLYRNWLRGLLGSAESETAQKYGEALYRAKTISWVELDSIRTNPETRNQIIERKAREWMRVAEQIKVEDPEAYQYLQGTKGMERIGAGFIALISAVMFALFDLTASLLVLLGFLIFRWAVIAAPIIGTIAILRPVSGGFRRLMHSVVAALFNIIVFGTGAAIYLHAVDLIMNTTTIPGWLQVVLVLLCGIVGWLLLRPYRRITQLGGKDPLAAIAAGGLFHRRQARIDQATTTATTTTPDRPGHTLTDRPPMRVELRPEPPLDITTTEPTPPPTPPPATTPAPRPRTPTGDGWHEPTQPTPGYTLYRPRPGRAQSSGRHEPPVQHPPIRAEARPEPDLR